MLREQLSELVLSYKQAGFITFRDIIAKMKDSTELLEEELPSLKYTQDTQIASVLLEIAGAKYEQLLKLQDIFEEVIPSEGECFRVLLK
jgi:hypothetical protein